MNEHDAEDATDGEDYAAADYRRAYEQVLGNAEELFRGAETRDIEEAARWYAERSTGSRRRATHLAALDALHGRPARH